MQTVDFPLYVFHHGKNYKAYEFFGAHPFKEGGHRGFLFRVWAPHAEEVSVVGDFNDWDPEANKMVRLLDGETFETKIDGLKAYSVYKYCIRTKDGRFLYKADPYAFHAETPSRTASKTYDLEGYKWSDKEYMAKRKARNIYASPMNIYEMNVLSWRQYSDGNYFDFNKLAEELIPYLKEMGYTHVEFMPLSEHPCDESWGYQNTGFFSPTARYGTADDLKFLIDTLHKNGIGAIMDYVPVHFALDGYGLAKYDGTNLYEHPTDDVGYSEWGSKNFIHSKGEVQTFLKSAANYWLTEYHFDGLRMDAISRIIYWMGDESRGVNDRAVEFIKGLNQGLKDRHPSCILCAEDSTDYKGTTKEVGYGGLGFDYKWDMGWMNDTLNFFRTLPFCRGDQYHKLTFSMMYFYNERYMLPLSHDEVVHGKATIAQKMAGSYEEKFPNAKALYAYMYAHPGKKLNFMGNEIAQLREWDEKREQDWDILKYPNHDSFNRFIKDLNKLYLKEPALSGWDDDPHGFDWILCGKEQDVVYIFQRVIEENKIVVVMNLSGNTYRDYHFRYGEGNSMKVLMNTDWNKYGGNTKDTVKSIKGVCGDFGFDLPALSVMYLKPVD